MPSTSSSAEISANVKQLLKVFDTEQEKLLQEFFDFLRFQSVSSEPEFAPEVLRCANWVKSFLEDAGMKVELWESEHHPVVFATWLGAGPDKPTLLIYNHYDVQPVDPLELWESPPFEPTLRGNEIYARGAEDNKGQCFYVMSAVRHLLKTNKSLPVNIKLCIEGEEETGSQGIGLFLDKKKEQLKADHLFIVDLGIHTPDSPALTLGVRGIVTMTVELIGSYGDLHSGTHGGVVYNPNRGMAELLATLHDSEGRVAIAGFYDDVFDVPAAELQKIDTSFNENEFRSMFGAKTTGGEKKFSAIESAWIRPTLEINGISGGYAGEGFKTVIPAKCLAKISCRLVPKQNPLKIIELVEKHLREHTPGGLDIVITQNHGSGAPALRTSSDTAGVRAAADVLTALFDIPCQYILSGGSIPIVPELAKAAGAEVVMMGFGLPDDNIHAPNEHFGIDRIKKGFATMAGIILTLGR